MANILEQAKNFLSEKVSNFPKPEADVTDVDLKGVRLDCITLLAKVAVSNPYPVSIPICEIAYSVKSGGNEIASGTIPDPGSLAASDKTMLDVTVKLPHSAVVSLMKDVGCDWDIDYVLDLGLIIDLPAVGNFTVPVSFKGVFKLPTLREMIMGKSDEKDEKEDKQEDKKSEEK